MIVPCKGEEFILGKERAMFWVREKMLIVSDVHIGKSAHFRKNGIQVPDTVGQTDLARLSSLLHEYEPDTLLITGDLFHNHINSDANAFLQWRRSFPGLKVVLVKGNHDALRNEDYEALQIEVHTEELIRPPFRFVHHPTREPDEYYNISGHIHPGVVLRGKARQKLRFPCFYFGPQGAVLPAFSVFTGLKILKPEEGERFYAVTPARIVEV